MALAALGSKRLVKYTVTDASYKILSLNTSTTPPTWESQGRWDISLAPVCGSLSSHFNISQLLKKATAHCRDWTGYYLRSNLSNHARVSTPRKKSRFQLKYCHSPLNVMQGLNLLVSRLHRAVYAVSSLLRVRSPGTRGGVYWILKQNKIKVSYRFHNITVHVLL